jgi:hypothetical protein
MYKMFSNNITIRLVSEYDPIAGTAEITNEHLGVVKQQEFINY